MQTKHRRRHRLMWFVLGPVILIVLIVSYLTRPRWPNNEPVQPSVEDRS